MTGASEGQLLNNIANDFSRWEYQTIALAAVAQCAALVNNLARDGRAPDTEMTAAINPLFVLNPGSTAEVYPRIGELNLGLRTLQDIFSNDRLRENAEVVRYTLGMLLLRNKLVANQPMQQHLRQMLQLTPPLRRFEQNKDEEFDRNQEIEQDRTFEQLADLYQDTISNLAYRIQVQGDVSNLKNELVANKVRALLLAGIRSAILWYQLGGRRWRLVFYRKRIQQTAGNIRRSLIAPV